jgi:GGDEF domain-containing protein
LEISQEENNAWMTDLSSTNGTLINGVEVNKRKLEVGDVLRVGDISMRLNRGFNTETPDLDDLFALSARDPLTGASTTHHYRVIREREASRSRRFHTPLAEATISLSVQNCPDTTIEECMWAVGRALSNVCRHEDVIGKLTSDCFALLMPHTGKHAGESAVFRLEQVVSETLPTHLKGLDIRYSVRQVGKEPSEAVL